MIDVIIPVYNSGKSIARTLNSVLDQINYQDICVTIVDDCSKEDYKDILNHFRKYFNIQYFRLDKNSGPGTARNFGLEKSKNDYVVFLDSDDEFFDKESVLKLYKSIDNCDIVFGQMLEEINGQKKIRMSENCLHGKMYRRSFLEDNHILFPTTRIKGGNAHEDNAFNQLCLSCTNKVKYLYTVIYRYKDTENSITNNENRIKSFKCFIKNMTWLFEQIEMRDKIQKYLVNIPIEPFLKIRNFGIFDHLIYGKIPW